MGKSTQVGSSTGEFCVNSKVRLTMGTIPDAAGQKLFSLRQGKRSVAQYFVGFSILAEEAKGEEQAKFFMACEMI